MIPFIPDVVPNVVQALVFVLAFCFAANTTLRKHPLPFYIGAIVTSVLTFIGPVQDNVIANTLVNILASCYTGVAMYLVVMFAGALPKKWTVTKMLLSIRSELSILAGIIILSHVLKVIFFVPMSFTGYWPLIWKSAAPIMWVASTLVGIPLLICFLVPWIMSFPKVRAGMEYKKWKKWQRLAYPFMALLVIQGILLSLGHAAYVGPSEARFIGYMINGATYLVIGVVYLVLKIAQRSAKKRKQAERGAEAVAENAAGKEVEGTGGREAEAAGETAVKRDTDAAVGREAEAAGETAVKRDTDAAVGREAEAAGETAVKRDTDAAVGREAEAAGETAVKRDTDAAVGREAEAAVGREAEAAEETASVS